jgi:hypothetical protein
MRFKVKVKGVDCKDIQLFVKDSFGESKYKEWVQSLPDESKKIYTGNIIEGFKYEIKSGFHIPLNCLCEMFYKPRIDKGAIVFGIWSGKRALSSVYKVFLNKDIEKYAVNIAKVFKIYYETAVDGWSKLDGNKITAVMTRFEEPDYLCDLSIMGYFVGGLELLNIKAKSHRLIKSLAKNDEVTEFIIEI